MSFSNNIRWLFVAGMVGSVALACSQPSVPTDGVDAERASETSDDFEDVSPEFIACFKSEAAKHPSPIVQSLALETEPDEGALSQLSEDESLTLTVFLMSLDTLCTGA